MKFNSRIRIPLLLLPLLVVCCFVSTVSAVSSVSEPAPEPEVSSVESNAVVARLSDEEVRSLLLEKLSEGENNVTETTKSQKNLVNRASGWLHLLDKDSTDTGTNSNSLMSIVGVVPSLYAALKTVGNNSLVGFFKVVAVFAVIFGLAFLAETLVRRFTKNFSRQFQEKAIPDLDGPMRFIAGIMRSIPAFIHIIVFCTAATLLFFLLTSGDYAPSRYLFLAILITVVFYRCINQLSQIICSPDSASLRVIPADDELALKLHKSILLFCCYIFTSVMFLALLKELQFEENSFTVLVIIVATLIIALIIYGILRSRTAVQEYILKQSDANKTRNWIIEQFAQFWHVPAILYFIIALAVLVNQQLSGIERESSAFLLSLLVLPLFIIFDAVGQWVVRASVNNLSIYNPEDEDDEELKDQAIEAKERERKISVTGSRIVRITIVVALLVWAASLWGYTIPFVSVIAAAVFESLITLALGLAIWRFASSYIEQKIQEATPEEVETEEDSDNEFGGAAQRGRSFTLLPMLRKFIATTLLVMITLVILSAFGVDIGPLLAGAGVIGLAVGFGAQKLVSDVFSGFFYLLDDAFRVGEYIQAGSVTGTVESISLRNVMLRHHRGMLQIVPHSSMGSITNYMRGGLIIKFNLEFPYDADIDKIRKIIKKVGQAMLQDEEIGDDFIRPIKSQGVRAITGSVMTIRVKFTAHPGTQFVIQREAYRRITEALNAKGIFYAHRKVIVELPADEQNKSTEDINKKLEAGAAAALSQIEEEEKQKAAAQTKKPSPMPGD